MKRLIVLATVLLAGCPIDRFNHYNRPAHAEIGFNTRHFSSGPPQVATRVTTPPPKDLDGTAASMSFRFTMRTEWNTYMGAEAEAGAFVHHHGSNLAGGYAVVGAGLPLRFGTLSAEMVGGWRSMRDSVDAEDQSFVVLEPRVRAELWLSPVLTLGAAAGAELTAQHSWMAGIYLGIHSHAYGRPAPAGD